MILSGLRILQERNNGKIVIEPFDPQFLGPNSYDVHLGDKLMVYDEFHGRVWSAIDSKAPPPLHEILQRREGGWVLEPGRLYLAATKEYTETRGYVPVIDGRSSLGRLGLFCHVTAGRGDNGFCGTWTLELVVVEPLILYPGQRIAQLTYHAIEGPQTFYGQTGNTSGRYQGQRDPTGIKLDNNKEDE